MPGRFSLKSLRTRLALFCSLLMVIVVLFTSLMSYLEGRQRVRAMQLQHLEDVVTRLSDDIDDRVRTRHVLLEQAAASLQVDKQHLRSHAGELLQTFRYLKGSFSSIMLFDADGNVVADYPELPGRRGSNVLDRQYFSQTRDTLRSQISEPVRVRDDIRRHLPRWPAEKIETLHNRLDVAAAQSGIVPREAAREALGLPQAVPVIGNVGRLHPDKDQATLIKGFAAALPRLPTGTLLAIAGSGPLAEALKALAAGLGIADRVRFLGQVPDVRRYFSAFDLFALSSDHEPFGMVLLEAMAAGVPVMATDCGGAPEVVADPARLFPLRDAAALADKLAAFFASGRDAGNELEHLRRHFSDEAARQRFFALPMVRQGLAT